MRRKPAQRKRASRSAVFARALLAFALGVAIGPAVVSELFARPSENCAANDWRCTQRSKASEQAAQAREELNRGDAEAAVERIEEASRHWREAIARGIDTGAQAALMAQKRLQMYTLTVWYDQASLDALAAQ